MTLSNLIAAGLFGLLFSCNTATSSAKTESNTVNTATVTTQPEMKDGITIEELDEQYADFEKAYFAGGCFWCTEASFDRINGVEDVYSGYTGGPEKAPTYRQVASGQTGHAEAIVVYYDPAVITYEKLLDVFFVAHDPTTLNRQGPDRGPQYRSGIYFLSPEQEKAALAKVATLEKAGKFDDPIVTEIEAASDFYVAEGYHQDYYEDPTNPNQSYVQNVSKPKVEKVMKTFQDILKPEYRKQP
ncbi:peptide-methionine (S)-S-oxide reductase [Lewinellaceae bacterium SD302]|nr:peptide-methionine (S)-S-oxide reductase [Lewinellaceae bacterium SD302]